jgi:glycine receptor
VFKWNLTDPLVTNPDIELPQLDIAKNFTEDCTLEYSTGKSFLENLKLFT